MYRPFRSCAGELIVAPQLTGKLEGRVRDGVAVLPSHILWVSEILPGEFRDKRIRWTGLGRTKRRSNLHAPVARLRREDQPRGTFDHVLVRFTELCPKTQLPYPKLFARPCHLGWFRFTADKLSQLLGFECLS
jgi:hypothetical protein